MLHWVIQTRPNSTLANSDFWFRFVLGTALKLKYVNFPF